MSLNLTGSTIAEPSRPTLPSALVEACEQAMNREPEERYQETVHLSSVIQGWLDGSRRREEALRVVHEADSRLVEVFDLKARASSLLNESQEELALIPSWETSTMKEPIWTKEDTSKRLNLEAQLKELEHEQLLQAALTHAPDLSEAHVRLCGIYRRVHESLESSGLNTWRVGKLLEYHTNSLPERHRSRREHLDYLKGDGAVTLLTEPVGVNVDLYRYTLKNRRLVLEFQRKLGHTPLRECLLPMGRYMLRLRAAGYHDAYYPVHIERMQHWDGCPPNSNSAAPVPLLPQGSMEKGDVYVPPGWFWTGGGPGDRVL